jgi:hypothetical protein
MIFRGPSRIDTENIRHSLAVLLFFSALFTLYFSPVIFFPRLLPSDGALPSFLSPLELWTNFVWAGYPAAADPQGQSWYPLSRFFHLLPHGFNAFIVSAYILAGSFTYGYVFTLTGSRLAALVAGTTFSMSGFMMAHLGHTTMIHAALWLPVVIWSLEKLRSNPSVRWFIAAVISIACNILGGHPQVFVVTAALASAYVVFFSSTAKDGWFRYVVTWLLVLTLGCALAAVQLLPTLELAGLSLRAEMGFEAFTSFSLPLFQTIQLLFPYLFGGSPLSPYRLPYFGEWSLQELAGYVGVLPLMLAAIGVSVRGRERFGLFWLITALVALLLTLGNATPLAKLMYLIPPMNMFRAPARHSLEMAFAVSILAGFGTHAIQTRTSSNKGLVTMIIAAGAVIMATSLVVIYALYGNLRAYAADKGVELIPLGTNPGAIIPLFVFLVSAIALAYWRGCHRSRICQAAILLVIVVNMGSFGWFYEWRDHAVTNEAFNEPEFATRYRRALDDSRQRLMQIPGGAPDMFRLHKLPSLSGYGPLQIKRFGELSGVTDSGSVQPTSLRADNRAIDLLAVRYILQTPIGTVRAHDIQWSSDDLAVNLGNECGQHQTEAEFRLAGPVRATRVGVVSNMGCSTSIRDDREVVTMSLMSEDGTSDGAVIYAGRDTSEWALDCNETRATVRHRRASVFASWPVNRIRFDECQAHKYFTTLPLPGGTYNRIKLKWSGAPGAINIAKISLIDEPAGKTRVVSPYEVSFGDRRTLRHVESVGGIAIFENSNALPRVWLVSEVVSAKPGDILKAIHTSVLPDGRTFDPRQMALVEAPLSVRVEEADPDATAEVVQMTNASVEIETSAKAPRFLVMSDIYYPGWKASIDGRGIHMLQTDYALRGVMLPAGRNTVRVEFRPLSVCMGGFSSGVAAVIILVLWGADLRRKYRMPGAKAGRRS